MISSRHQSVTAPGLALVCIAALFLAAPIGCGKKDPVKPAPTNYLPQSSLTNAVRNLRQAYLDRNLQEYRKLFSSDFTYVFNPVDVQDPRQPSPPPSWYYDEECAAAESLFVADLVDSIDVNFDLSQETNADLEHPGTWKLFAQNVRLSVDTHTADGSWLTLQTPGDVIVTFYGKQDTLGARASDGKPLWRIWRWEDQAVESGMKAEIETWTWGSIKFFFFN
jgi:hypothetical protein